jgi:hypothetical protein
LRIVKGPNVKKLLSLAALAALAVPALPATAATNATNNAIVKWNTQVAASITLTTTYNWSSPTLSSSGSATLYTGTAGTCASQTGETNGTINFGNISPSMSGSVNCLYTNAVNANVQTNSTSWTMYEEMNTPLNAGSAATLTGYTFCAYPNGYASFPATISSVASASNSTRSAATTDTTTCGAGSVTIPQSATTGVLASSAGTATIATGSVASGAAGTNIGEDLEMLIAPTATSGADQYSLQYLVIAN